MPVRPPPKGALRLVVVGDDPLARAGLAGVLGPEGVVGQAGPDEDLAALAASLRADVVLWDLGLDPRPRFDRLADLIHSEVATLGLASSEGQAREGLRRGLRGVLFRDADPERLDAAIAAVASGLVVLDDLLAESLIPQRVEGDESPVETLTPREVEVLGLLSQGLANKAIAERLGISEHTAKFHVNSIISKLGAEGRTEAVVRAAKLGLVVL